jgi:putative tricarboxylic transport membrane protein
MFEEKLRQSLLYSSGSFLVFVQRPLSAVFVAAAFVLLVSPLAGMLFRKKMAPLLAGEGTALPRRYDLASASFLLCFSLYYMGEAAGLGIGTARVPAPGFFPLILGGILSILSLVLLYAAATKKEAGTPSPGLWHGLKWPKTVLILASLLAYTFLLEPLGYLAATLLLMLYLFKGIEPQTWRVAITGAVLSSGVTYLLFKTLLQIQLPRGFFNIG